MSGFDGFNRFYFKMERSAKGRERFLIGPILGLPVEAHRFAEENTEAISRAWYNPRITCI